MYSPLVYVFILLYLRIVTFIILACLSVGYVVCDRISLLFLMLMPLAEISGRRRRRRMTGFTQLHGEAACLSADNVGGVGGMAGGIAGGIGAGVGGVMSIARQQFERRFTDVSYDLLISKTFYFFFYAAFGSVNKAVIRHSFREMFSSSLRSFPFSLPFPSFLPPRMAPQIQLRYLGSIVSSSSGENDICSH